MDSSGLVMYDEGNRIVMDMARPSHPDAEHDEDETDQEGDTAAPTIEQMTAAPGKRQYQSFMERVLGVRNKQCETARANRQTALQQCHQQTLEKLSKEELRLRYHLKVMQVDLHRNELEQRKRENPELDTTFDDMLIKHATKYLIVDPDDCCYMNKTNRHPVRMPTAPGTITPLVAQARKALQDKDVQRQMAQLQLKKNPNETGSGWRRVRPLGSMQSGGEVVDSDQEGRSVIAGAERVSQTDGFGEGQLGSDQDNTNIDMMRPVVPTLLQTHYKKQQLQAQVALKAVPPQGVAVPRSIVASSQPTAVTRTLRRSHTTVGLPAIVERSPPHVSSHRTLESDSSKTPRKCAHGDSATIGKSLEYDSDDEDYDHAEIMDKLRRAGILNSGERVDFRNHRVSSDITPRQRPRTSVRVFRQPLTLDMLKEESEVIQKKLKHWFYDLEVYQKRERNKRLAQRQRLRDEGERAKADIKYGTMNVDENKKLNLMLSFRSKVMREKWQNATAKMMLKTEGKSAPAVDPPPEESSVPTGPKPPDKAAKSNGSRRKEYQRWSSPAQRSHTSPQPGFNTGRHTRERSRRHSLTYKLRRMVEDVLAHTSTQERMQYDQARQDCNFGAIPESGTL